ncbi:bifunctional glutamate N-acetyltransferase/amino-acid acetyltransferase ArgJ [Abyssibacter sp.]|uniref:bifunctional glutamate N-acetyltransferase/amino-acid acetyltransferase ArgJ n=1 Tax=Abyssibacter sp. TaxID=2320200 RepID=UPI003219917D
MADQMAVGLSSPERLAPVKGVRLAAVEAGIRYRDRTDLALIELAPGARAAVALTNNVFAAAPVRLCREHRGRTGRARAWLINSGNANAGTGESGVVAARASCAAVAQALGCAADEVWPFSTGVIGEALPAERVTAAIPAASARLDEDAWLPVAQAIMTTDSLPKGLSRTVTLSNGERYTITGIGKGAGMIRPDMATMLAFVATDAPLSQAAVEQILSRAIDASFHCITVDGDTSTNDACALAATGTGPVIEIGTPDYRICRDAIIEVCQHLAQSMVRDGEGASKFVTVQVENARSVDEARKVAMTVAHSPLVKTAWFASDPNWGRVLAAVGRSGLEGLRIDQVDLWIDDQSVLQGGEPSPNYVESLASEAMRREAFTVRIRLGRGAADAVIWTCDLGHEYVRINAEYRS